MKTLHVELGARSYPIYIGSGLLGRAELMTPHFAGKEVMIVTNETVAPLYLQLCLESLQGYKTDFVSLPDGEEYKTLEVMSRIFDALLAKRFSRRTTIVALGGGVIGDMAGFAAACYQRGVAFIQVPTTLLAQVDSSVGGKTGVNHPLGKNMIGAFCQPRCVIADTDTLSTLDDRQFRAGVAEVIKYGIIRDAPFFAWLEKNIVQVMRRDPGALSYIIEKSCQNKADVVALDENETGIRAILNLGHTFGHAIETGAGYGQWLHGEAVAIGMHMAAIMSQRLGFIGEAELARIKALLLAANLPIFPPNEITTERFLELMSVDKKVADGKIRLVLVEALGSAIITDNFETTLLRDVIEQCRAASAG